MECKHRGRSKLSCSSILRKQRGPDSSPTRLRLKNNPLLLAMIYLLMFPQLFQNAPPSANQVFKHTSLSRRFQIQMTDVIQYVISVSMILSTHMIFFISLSNFILFIIWCHEDQNTSDLMTTLRENACPAIQIHVRDTKEKRLGGAGQVGTQLHTFNQSLGKQRQEKSP